MKMAQFWLLFTFVAIYYLLFGCVLLASYLRKILCLNCHSKVANFCLILLSLERVLLPFSSLILLLSKLAPQEKALFWLNELASEDVLASGTFEFNLSFVSDTSELDARQLDSFGSSSRFCAKAARQITCLSMFHLGRLIVRASLLGHFQAGQRRRNLVALFCEPTS